MNDADMASRTLRYEIQEKMLKVERDMRSLVKEMDGLDETL